MDLALVEETAVKAVITHMELLVEEDIRVRRIKIKEQASLHKEQRVDAESEKLVKRMNRPKMPKRTTWI